jgi:DNA-binding transcriptional regulator YiaG
MLDTMKAVDPKWSERMTALQAKLGFTPKQMADKFGVEERTYLSWKYRERNPSKTAVKLLEMFEKKAGL